MKKIFAIIWKDAVVRFTSPWELMFFIVLPLVFTFLLAGGTGNGQADPRIRLLVVDEAGSPVSAQILSELGKSTAVWPEVLTRPEGQAQFDERRAAALLIVPAGLDWSALQAGRAEVELLQQPNNLNALVAERAISTALRQVSAASAAASQAVQLRAEQAPFASQAEKQAYFDESLAAARRLQAETPERVTVRTANTPDRVEYDPRANSSAGQLVTWVFIPLFGISGMFAYERQQGTLRRLLSSPTSKATFLLGTISGQVLFALLQMLLLILFGKLALHLEWGRDLPGLALILFSAALAAAALGTAMGTFIKTESQAGGLSIMFGMVMALLGGCWYPLELFPAFVRTIVHILPTTWAMQGLLDLVLRGRGLVDILPEAAVLLGFALVFFAIGVWRFRFE
ncbi:MAG: ABC transporter permease [Anaerolineales bacterium]|jgi:ABC-2 type transport system permease protein|nr:ABC transporter permease [Anaerolineales bacterium]